MKRVKQSKKRWARTEAQGRRDGYCTSWASDRYRVPKDFVQEFINSNEAEIRKSMREINAGIDPEEVFFKVNYMAKCTAEWWWL
jgi:hypothetical protein